MREPDARRFTQSTMSYVSIAGLTVSIEQLLSLGRTELKRMHVNCAMLVVVAREYGWEPFHDVDGVAASPHIMLLGHSRTRARETVERLRNQRIICSARGERIRVFLAPYNDASDVVTSCARANFRLVLLASFSCRASSGRQDLHRLPTLRVTGSRSVL